jgi:hypothetical protein
MQEHRDAQEQRNSCIHGMRALVGTVENWSDLNCKTLVTGSNSVVASKGQMLNL